MSRFKNLAPAAPAPTPSPTASEGSGARAGKKGITGWFSPALSAELRSVALAENISLQAVMGEAFDLFLRSRDRHPYGER